MAMAFDIQRLAPADMNALLQSRIAPANRAVVSRDNRLHLMTSLWFPWVAVDIPQGTVHVVGEDHMAGLFYDELPVDITLLSTVPPPALILTSCKGTAIQQLLTAAVGAGMAAAPYSTREDFLSTLRRYRDMADPKPYVVATDLITAAPTDFTTAPYDTCSALRFLEGIPLARLHQDEHVSCWGLLHFTLTPVGTDAERWGEDCATHSIAEQWLNLLSTEFYGGTIPRGVRAAALTETACQSLLKAQKWTNSVVYASSSVGRELDLVRILALGSNSDVIRAPSFSHKLVDIIQLSGEVGTYKRVMGSTSDSCTVYGYHRQLASIFAPKEEPHSLACVIAICGALGTRLGFMDVQGFNQSDAEIMREITTAWHCGNSRTNTPAITIVPSGNSTHQLVTASTASNLQMDKMVLSKRFAEFKIAIRLILAEPGVTSARVRSNCFQWCIPFVNQFMIGKRQCRADVIFCELSEHRCTSGSDGTCELEIGKAIGQCMVSATPGEFAGFTLARTKPKEVSILNYFLQGKTSSLNMENQLLSSLTLHKSTMPDKHVGEADRFLEYQLLDRMVEEIGPIFEYFGLGGLSGADSFASILSEAKRLLRDLNGLSSDDTEDLLRGEEYGIQTYILEALQDGDRTLKTLFQTDDPSVTIARGVLIQPESERHYDVELSDARTIITRRLMEQRSLPSARARLLGQSAEVQKLHSRIAALEARQTTSKNKRNDHRSDDKGTVHLLAATSTARYVLVC